MSGAAHPIEGQVVLLVGAKASVTLRSLSGLLETVQAHLATDEFERSYERIEGAEVTYYLVDDGFWERIGAELDLDAREIDAVRRAHATQFERDGRRLDRQDEFETALEIREVVTVSP